MMEFFIRIELISRSRRKVHCLKTVYLESFVIVYPHGGYDVTAKARLQNYRFHSSVDNRNTERRENWKNIFSTKSRFILAAEANYFRLARPYCFLSIFRYSFNGPLAKRGTVHRNNISQINYCLFCYFDIS